MLLMLICGQFILLVVKVICTDMSYIKKNCCTQACYDFIYDSVRCIVQRPSLNPNWWSGMTVDRPRSFLILFNSSFSKSFENVTDRLIGR
jgi:hypothetical protein